MPPLPGSLAGRFDHERKPTIHDVASAASVSISTASKALNGRGKLSAATIQRVREAAAHLDYRPNALMQSVLRGRSYTVGLIATLSAGNDGRFSNPLVIGIEDALTSADISVFLCLGFNDDARERRHIDSLLRKQVDGIIVTSAWTNRRTPIDIGSSRIPVLYAYTYVDDPDALCLLPDDAQGARLATAHLLRAGRHRLAHITGPLDYEAVVLRRDAMRQVLAQHGLAIEDDCILYGPWHQRWGYEAAEQLLREHPDIDGIFCGSDQIARGVLDALQERGRRVPHDLSVVGFDNWDLFAIGASPQLTTIDMQIYELGRRAGLRLLALINGERESGIVRLPCTLMVRESCGLGAVLSPYP